MDVEVNIVAVLLATATSIVVGMIWYHPKVLGDTWVKLAKIDPKKGNTQWSIGSVVVSSLIMAYVLAHVTYLANSFFGNSYLEDALYTAVWLWLGFQGARMIMHDQFNQRRKKETLIHVGNDLVTILAMGLVIGAIGL